MTAHDADKILPLMIGTAGHVDHGKTSLVKSLTGFDTDTRKEEKLRGLSIDFGVAPCPLGEGRLSGLIDVPGHEDFIRNMVAGASSIDLLLLVVSAAEGMMPQTNEHLQIANELGIRRLVVALTKADLVDKATLELAAEEIRLAVEAHGYAEPPVVPVSNMTGQGIDALKEELAREAESLSFPVDPRGFRMYVRHVFTAHGHGTVATGIPVSGRCAVGEPLELHPGGAILTARAMQSYRTQMPHAQARVSAALNLRDAPENLARGMCLTTPGLYRETRRVLVRISNSGQHGLKNRRQVRFLVGTASVVGKVQLLGAERHGGQLHVGDELPAGAPALALIHLAEPLVVAGGDRAILRTLSPSATLGGALVLSTEPGRTRRSDPLFRARLQSAASKLEAGDLTKAVLLAGGKAVLGPEALVGALNAPPEFVRSECRRLQQEEFLTALDGAHFLIVERLPEVVRLFRALLLRYHQRHPHALGMKVAHAAAQLGIPNAALEGLLRHLSASGVVARHGYLSLKEHAPKTSPREQKLRDTLLALLEKAGPAGEPRGMLKDKLQADETELKQLLKLLGEEGQLAVAGNHLFTAALVEQWRAALTEYLRARQRIDLKAFRELSNTSRTVAVSVLELFDTEGLTKREGESRVLARRI